jgi:hypothetical protein
MDLVILDEFAEWHEIQSSKSKQCPMIQIQMSEIMGLGVLLS